MKKRRLSLVATAVRRSAACLIAISMMPLATWAQDPDPYANVVEADQFSTITPSGNFSIQARLNAGETFALQNAGGKTFSYTSGVMAAHSFLVNVTADTVGVFAGGQYVARIPLKVVTVATTNTATIGGLNLVILTEQSAGAQQGIYNTRNLLRNPGFEEYASFTQGDEASVSTSTDTRGRPAQWNYVNTGWRLQNTVMNSGYANMHALLEGFSALMIHNSQDYIWQDITGGIKANQWYKVQYRQAAHGDTSSPATWTAYVTRDSANVAAGDANVIAKYSYQSAEQGQGNYVDPVFAFRSSEVVADAFFSVKKTTNTINHLDRMTMQELQNSEVTIRNTITCPAPRVSWDNGLLVPVGGGEVVYEDVTAIYFVNPSFDEQVSAQTNVSPYNASASVATASSSNNGGINQPYGWTIDYAKVSQTGDVWDQANVNNGFTPAAIGKGDASPDVQGGNLPVDGDYFFYYRSRWVGNQDFAIYQQTKEALPVGYYNLTFWAAAPDAAASNPATITIVEEDQQIVLDHTDLRQYTIPLNLVAPSKLTFKASQVRAADAASSLLLDGIQLIYCGEADEAAALAIAVQKMKTLYERLISTYDPITNANTPGGSQAAFYAADELYMMVDENDISSVREALAALQYAWDSAEECSPVYLAFSDHIAYAMNIATLDYSGKPELTGAIAAAMAILESMDDDIFKAEIEAADAALIAAVRSYLLSARSQATETTPYELTFGDDLQLIISAPTFTKVGGDQTLSDDRYRGAWLHANDPSTGGDYRMNTVNGYNCWNNWSNNFVSLDLYQEITNLPEGMYAISCQTTTNALPNDNHAYVQSLAGTAKSSVATYYISGGDFATEAEWENLTTDKIYVPEGGTLRIGMAANSGGGTSGWYCATDFKLLYYAAPANAAQQALDLRVNQLTALLTNNDDLITGEEKVYAQAIIAQAQAANTQAEMAAAFELAFVAEDTLNYVIKQCDEFLTSADAASAIAADPIYANGDKTAFENVIADVMAQRAAATNIASGKNVAIFAELKAILDKATDDFFFSVRINDVIALEDAGVLEGATRENPVDLTSLIINPTIEAADNNEVPEGWTITRVDGNTNTTAGQHYDGNESNRYLDSYNSTAGRMQFTVSQNLVVPNGLYLVTMAARTSGAGSYLYANGDTIQFEVFNASGGPIWEAAAEGDPIKLANDGNGWGWKQYSLEVRVYNDNLLTIGVTNKLDRAGAAVWTGSWFSADDFMLQLIEPGWKVGIEEIGEEGASFTINVDNGVITVDGATNYKITSIDGVVVSASSRLAPGYYLVSAAGKTVKVFVP